LRPVLFKIGSFEVPSYYTLINLGIIIGFIVFYFLSKKENIKRNNAIDIAIIISITAYFGAKIFHIIFENFSFYLKNPIEIIYFWKSGYVYYGGILTSVLFVYIYAKIKKLDLFKIFDLLSIGVSLGTGIGRIACLLQGCCYGIKTNVPWSIFLHGAFRHPTQVYLSLNSFMIFFILLLIYKYRKKLDGTITFFYLILYSIGRSIIEFYRADFRGSFFEPYLSTSQAISIFIIITSIIIIIYRNKVKIHKE
jgi:phosphatidylglycerol---prolipoprotein diacylglyceryl transferase